MKVMHCWNRKWLEAAQRAGLAIYKGAGQWQFLNDEMRIAMAQFAEEIVSYAVSEEREACAKVCDRYDNGKHSNAADLCADAIRARSMNAGNGSA